MQHPDHAAIGELGWAVLREAFDEGDATGFGRAADLLREALASEPDHPDEPRWHHGLALALVAIAETTDAEADWCAALDEFGDVWVEPPPGVERGDVAVDIAYVLAQSFAAANAAGDEDPDSLDGLVAALDALQGPSLPRMPVVDMHRGRARLMRFGLLADPADQMEGMALLSAALPQVADDTAMLADSCTLLAVFATTDSEVTETALDAVGRARRLTDPDDLWPGLDEVESELLYARWLSSDDPDVLDETIERLERLCATAATPDGFLMCGELRVWRGLEKESLTDLDAGVRWLELADSGVQPEDSAAVAFLLGVALMKYAGLTGRVAERERALACLGSALSAGLSTPELELEARRQRLEGLLLEMFRDWPAGASVEGDLAEGLAALDGYPDASADRRATLALSLARTELVLSMYVAGSNRLDDVTRLLDIAAGHPAPTDAWDALIGVYKSMSNDVVAGLGTSDSYIIRSQLMEVLKNTPVPETVGPLLRSAIGIHSMRAGLQSGDLRDQHAGSSLLDEDVSASGALMSAVARAFRAAGGHQLSNIERLIAVEPRPDTSSWEDRILREYMVPFLQVIRAQEGLPNGVLPELPARTIGGPATAGLAAVIDIMRSAAELAATPDAQQQLPMLADIARQTRALPVGSLERTLATDVLSTSWLSRAKNTKDPHDTAEAISWSSEVIDSLGGPEHFMWTRSAMNAARAHRLRASPADRDRSRELGLDVLRGHGWQVLLQSGTEHAIAVARTASADAVRVARWCLHDRDFEGLVAALDAGRGLVLHAAVTSRSVTEQLRAAGEAELAREWAESGGGDLIELPGVDLHGDLRRRVLRALGAGRSPLLDPPTIAGIREALVATDADALVYLVAVAEGEPGLAVVVTAREPVEVVELPELDAATAAELAGRALGRTGRDIGPELLEPRHGGLADLIGWAWRVTGSELAATAESLRRSDGRLPRLLLVPFGALAHVPWHAAGRMPELAVVSTVPSARLLCQATSRPAWPGAGQLVVGNPTGDLPGAEVEALAVVGAFYPEATYLGRDGSAAQVVERLGKPLSLLHLACHALADPTAPDRSRLRLADRDVAVDEVLALRPTAPLDVGIVCLAACSTNVPGEDYDEAFSLAATFLAAGARTVFASMWSVPDDHTSRLMFMIHRYLSEGCPPAEALHRARRWALDPHRVAPDSMPPALLHGMDGAEDVVAWAGFQHLGA